MAGAKTFGAIRATPAACGGVNKHRLAVMKSDDDKKQIFGWASVAVRANGEEIEDLQGDIIEIGELEQAAYEFVLHHRSAGEMHERGGVGRLIESVVFTKEKIAAIGIPDGFLPLGLWIGFQIDDDEVWQKVKAGDYLMLSIEGTADRIPID